eukprot:2928938-Alexandrium_andersonii.AAC.1
MLTESFTRDWWQHFPKARWFVSDPGGCYVSDEFKTWCGQEGLGIHQIPGQVHLGSVEEYIRTTRRTLERLQEEFSDVPIMQLA